MLVTFIYVKCTCLINIHRCISTQVGRQGHDIHDSNLPAPIHIILYLFHDKKISLKARQNPSESARISQNPQESARIRQKLSTGWVIPVILQLGQFTGKISLNPLPLSLYSLPPWIWAKNPKIIIGNPWESLNHNAWNKFRLQWKLVLYVHHFHSNLSRTLEGNLEEIPKILDSLKSRQIIPLDRIPIFLNNQSQVRSFVENSFERIQLKTRKEKKQEKIKKESQESVRILEHSLLSQLMFHNSSKNGIRFMNKKHNELAPPSQSRIRQRILNK